MTDIPTFPRDMLATVFNGNQRMINSFEILISLLQSAVTNAESAAGASEILDAASLVLATADSRLAGAKVLTSGPGVNVVDGGTLLTLSVTDLVPQIVGDNPARFIVTAPTNLILPTIGQLATLGDVQAVVAGAVTSFNTRTGDVTLLSADVTGALGYTPTSVTGLTGAQSVAAFKTGLALVKADVGLGSVDNTADAAKNVLSATKLTTSRNFTITGDGSWTVAFDGTANVSAALTLATVNANVGSFGGAAKTITATVNAKGLITAFAETNIAISASQVTNFDEAAQDAVGAMLDSSLVYVDGTPLLTRAALTGDATAAQGSNALTVVKINGVSLAGLATGILKNTTGTGAPSIAVAADFPTLNQNTTGSAATLTTSRNFSISGGGITAAAVGFNGSAAVTLSASVDAGHITLARMADIATDRLIGRDTAGTGVPEALTVGGGVEFTGSGGIQRSALTGDVTATAGSNATTIANDAVTYAKMQNVSATNRILGRITAGSGDPEELTAANVKTILSLAQADISGLTTADSPQFTAVNVGHASDSTITRVSAGVLAIEGANILVSGGALGTPASGTLTNCTGLPISSGVSGLGTGVATFLAAPSSANLLAALTTKTGTGDNVFSISPTFTGTVTVAALTASGKILSTVAAGSINQQFNQATASVANNGTFDFAAGIYNFVEMYDTTFGRGVFFFTDGTFTVSIIWQDAANLYSNTLGTAGKVNIYFNGATVRIQNLSGFATTFYINRRAGHA